MTKDTKAPFTLADMKAQVATEETFEFEPTFPDLKPSGIILKLKSDLAPSVQTALKAMAEADRKKDHLRAAQNAKARPESVILQSIDEIAEFGRKGVAVRIAGWSLDEEFTPANVDDLIKHWKGLDAQILAKSAELASFTVASPKV